MYQIPTITSDSNQQFTLNIPDATAKATLTLRYMPRIQSWYFDLTYQAVTIQNRKVCSSPNLLRQWVKILPFGIACYTLDNSDPYFLNDFETGRCGLLVLTPTEIDNYETILSGIKDAQA